MSKHNTDIQSWRSNKIPLVGKLIIFISFGVLLGSYPYVLNRLITLPSEQIISVVVLLVMVIANSLIKGNQHLPKTIKIFFLIQSFFWFLYFCYHSDSSYLVRILNLILTFLILSALIKTDSLIEFVKINNILVAVQAVLAAIGFILVFIGILSSLGDFTNIDSRPFRWYGITCSNVKFGNFIRVSGFFDEPGALAYWGIFALIFNKLFYGNKTIEICLIVSLFFTLSAAYFVQIFVYILCFNSRKKGLIIIACIFIITLLLFNYLGDSEFLRYMTLDRFEGGEIRSERTELSEIAKSYFLKNPIMGMGAKNMESTVYMADNPYEIPAKDGIIGTIITYLPYIYILLRYGKHKMVFNSVLVLGLGYLQRPFHINELHYLMMYSFVTMVVLKYGKNENVRKNICGDSMLQLS